MQLTLALSKHNLIHLWNKLPQCAWVISHRELANLQRWRCLCRDRADLHSRDRMNIIMTLNIYDLPPIDSRTRAHAHARVLITLYLTCSNEINSQLIIAIVWQITWPGTNRAFSEHRRRRSFALQQTTREHASYAYIVRDVSVGAV